ncbi:hypothetical protein JT358_00745 [Micrococcales bacterium 31B]|nr:hypothetical protein [Micrococcales bacterium 31B]
MLYVYDKLRQKHGQQFLEQLRDQNPEWIRGTAVPTFMVGAENTETLGNLTGSPVADKATAFIPSGDDTFVSRNQRAAVFKESPNTSAGELYIAWVTSKEFQSTMTGWNTRTDLAPGSGLPELSEIPGTDPVDFINWMADRENVATVRDEMAAIFGPVEGESPLLDPAQLEFLQIDPARAIAEPEPTDPIL